MKERTKTISLPIIIAIFAALFILIRWMTKKPPSPRNFVGTESILFEDTTFIVTTKIDTLYYDPKRAEEQAIEDAKEVESYRDR